MDQREAREFLERQLTHYRVEGYPPSIPGTPYLIPDLEEREEEGFAMVRLARVVAPGIPHHITQRGNRRQATFFCAEDYQEYRVLVGEWCRACAVEEARRLRRYERTGRPLGSERFTMAVEKQLRRTLRRGKPGPQSSRAS